MRIVRKRRIPWKRESGRPRAYWAPLEVVDRSSDPRPHHRRVVERELRIVPDPPDRDLYRIVLEGEGTLASGLLLHEALERAERVVQEGVC